MERRIKYLLAAVLALALTAAPCLPVFAEADIPAVTVDDPNGGQAANNTPVSALPQESTDQPGQTEQTVEPDQPSQPEQTVQPTQSNPPIAIIKPTEPDQPLPSDQPVETNQSTQTEHPEKTTQSPQTSPPAQSGQLKQTDQPTPSEQVNGDNNHDADNKDEGSAFTKFLRTHMSLTICVCVGLLLAIAILVILVMRKNRSNKFDKGNAQNGGNLTVPRPNVIRAANIQGIGARSNQQDSFAISDVSDTRNGLMAVVADGIGGGAEGAEISKIAVNRIMDSFRNTNGNIGSPPEFLLRAYADANDKARSFLRAHGGIVGGSTVVAVYAKDNALWFASAGDSRICLLRNGALVQLNREHTRASILDEKAARGEISLTTSRGDAQRAALTSFIGVEGKMQIDRNAQPIHLLAGDRVLLMSDGVFGTVGEEELAMAAGIPDIFAAGAAVERAVLDKNRPNQDNYTAILLAF